MRAHPNGSGYLRWMQDPPRFPGRDAVDLEFVDERVKALLLADDSTGNGLGSQGSGPGRPWGAPFAGLPPGGGSGAVLEYLVKSDADVHYCPTQLLPYATALLAPHVPWKHNDLPPELSSQQVAALHGDDGSVPEPQFVWAGKGPYGNKSIIRCV